MRVETASPDIRSRAQAAKSGVRGSGSRLCSARRSPGHSARALRDHEGSTDRDIEEEHTKFRHAEHFTEAGTLWHCLPVHRQLLQSFPWAAGPESLLTVVTVALAFTVATHLLTPPSAAGATASP